MLTKLIVNFCHIIVEFILWITLIASILLGVYLDKNGMFKFLGIDGFWVSVVMFLLWLIFSAIFAGGFLLIHDIRERVKNIEQLKLLS